MRQSLLPRGTPIARAANGRGRQIDAQVNVAHTVPVVTAAPGELLDASAPQDPQIESWTPSMNLPSGRGRSAPEQPSSPNAPPRMPPLPRPVMSAIQPSLRANPTPARRAKVAASLPTSAANLASSTSTQGNRREAQPKLITAEIKRLQNWYNLRVLILSKEAYLNCIHAAACMSQLTHFDTYDLKSGERAEMKAFIDTLLLPLVASFMPSMAPRELTTCMHALAVCGHKPNAAWSSRLLYFATDLIELFSPRDLSTLIWAVGKLSAQPSTNSTGAADSEAGVPSRPSPVGNSFGGALAPLGSSLGGVQVPTRTLPGHPGATSGASTSANVSSGSKPSRNSPSTPLSNSSPPSSPPPGPNGPSSAQVATPVGNTDSVVLSSFMVGAEVASRPHLHRCSPQALALMSGATVRLLAKELGQNRPTSSAAAANIQYYVNDEWAEGMVYYSLMGMHKAKPEDLVSLVSALPTLTHNLGEEWLHAFHDAVLSHIHAFSPQQLSNTLLALARLSQQQPHLALASAPTQGGGANRADSSHTSSTSPSRESRHSNRSNRSPAPWYGMDSEVSDLDVAGVTSTTFLKDWLTASTSAVAGFNGFDITHSLWAMNALRVKPPPEWLKLMMVQSKGVLTSVPGDRQALLLWSLSELRWQPGWQWMMNFYEASLPTLAASNRCPSPSVIQSVQAVASSSKLFSQSRASDNPSNQTQTTDSDASTSRTDGRGSEQKTSSNQSSASASPSTGTRAADSEASVRSSDGHESEQEGWSTSTSSKDGRDSEEKGSRDSIGYAGREGSSEREGKHSISAHDIEGKTSMGLHDSEERASRVSIGYAGHEGKQSMSAHEHEGKQGMSAHDLSLLVLALGRLKIRPMETWADNLLGAISTELAAGRMHGRALASTAWGLYRMQLLPGPTLLSSLLTAACEKDSQQWDLAGRVVLAWSLSRLSLNAGLVISEPGDGGASAGVVGAAAAGRSTSLPRSARRRRGQLNLSAGSLRTVIRFTNEPLAMDSARERKKDVQGQVGGRRQAGGLGHQRRTEGVQGISPPGGGLAGVKKGLSKAARRVKQEKLNLRLLQHPPIKLSQLRLLQREHQRMTRSTRDCQQQLLQGALHHLLSLSPSPTSTPDQGQVGGQGRVGAEPQVGSRVITMSISALALAKCPPPSIEWLRRFYTDSHRLWSPDALLLGTATSNRDAGERGLGAATSGRNEEGGLAETGEQVEAAAGSVGAQAFDSPAQPGPPEWDGVGEVDGAHFSEEVSCPMVFITIISSLSRLRKLYLRSLHSKHSPQVPKPLTTTTTYPPRPKQEPGAQPIWEGPSSQWLEAFCSAVMATGALHEMNAQQLSTLVCSVADVSMGRVGGSVVLRRLGEASLQRIHALWVAVDGERNLVEAHRRAESGLLQQGKAPVARDSADRVHLRVLQVRPDADEASFLLAHLDQARRRLPLRWSQPAEEGTGGPAEESKKGGASSQRGTLHWSQSMKLCIDWLRGVVNA
eukprot:gene3447-13503_t